MFLMIGIEDGRKDLEYTRTVLCQSCGRYGHFIVFMTFTSLLLFFIPCFRWNRQYYVQMSCCGRTYRLDPEVGKRIAKGEDVEIRNEDLEPVDYGWQNNGYGGWQNNGYGGWQNNGCGGWQNNGYNDGYNGNRQNNGNNGNWQNNGFSGRKRCFFCGHESVEDFDYCPKCGRRADRSDDRSDD